MNEPLDRSAISPCSMKGNEGNHNMNAQTCSRPGPEKVHGVGTSVCQALTSQGGASSELAPLPARSLAIAANGHARSDTSAREPEIGEATALCLRCDAMRFSLLRSPDARQTPRGDPDPHDAPAFKGGVADRGVPTMP